MRERLNSLTVMIARERFTQREYRCFLIARSTTPLVVDGRSKNTTSWMTENVGTRTP